jgi:hypothetical protein
MMPGGRFLLCAALCAGAPACSYRVALYCDENTPCTDPSRPFCDLAGEFAASEGIGNTCIPDPEPDAGAQDSEPNIVFVTSRDYAGELGGLEGADAICNRHAMEANLPGTYVAWLSTAAIDARDRLAGAGGWVRTDGLPVAGSVDDLIAGRIFYPPTLDENGNFQDVGAWTGTQTNGAYDAGHGDCEGWTSARGTAMTGSAAGGFQVITTFVPWICRLDFALLCFGIDRNARVESPSETGRLAFVTRAALDGRAGVAAFDEMCAREASAAGHLGTFLAAVTTNDSVPPGRRMNVDGPPWVRTDGARVFASAAGIQQGDSAMLAPIQYPADGVEPLNVRVWTGGSGFNGTNPSCSNWSGGLDPHGITGLSASAGHDASAHGAADCGESFAVYCFEQ